MGIHQKLALVQAELKAPKNQYNKFGGYDYRSAEDILEAVKPLAIKNGCVVTITDAIEQIGDRYYVSACAMITDCENAETACSTAYAREADARKGMDDSQVTGSASSYARKYALNGLFAIDDAKDADTGVTPDSAPKQTQAPVSPQISTSKRMRR